MRGSELTDQSVDEAALPIDPWKPQITELYNSTIQQFLPYVALTIAAFVPQIELAIAVIVKPSTVIPWPAFVLVLLSDGLTLAFAFTAMARYELIARIEWHRDVERTFKEVVGVEGRGGPLSHRFVRWWFGMEHAFFGFDPKPPTEDWQAAKRHWLLFKISSGRPLLPGVILGVVFGVVGWLIGTHVTWPSVTWPSI